MWQHKLVHFSRSANTNTCCCPHYPGIKSESLISLHDPLQLKRKSQTSTKLAPNSFAYACISHCLHPVLTRMKNERETLNVKTEFQTGTSNITKQNASQHIGTSAHRCLALPQRFSRNLWNHEHVFPLSPPPFQNTGMFQIRETSQLSHVFKLSLPSKSGCQFEHNAFTRQCAKAPDTQIAKAERPRCTSIYQIHLLIVLLEIRLGSARHERIQTQQEKHVEHQQRQHQDNDDHHNLKQTSARGVPHSLWQDELVMIFNED